MPYGIKIKGDILMLVWFDDIQEEILYAYNVIRRQKLPLACAINRAVVIDVAEQASMCKQRIKTSTHTGLSYYLCARYKENSKRTSSFFCATKLNLRNAP